MNTNQRKVLRIMTASPECKTIAKVAQEADLSEGTIYNYLGDPEFKQALYELLDKETARANATLAAGTDRAIQAFIDILEDPESSANLKRLTACNWLDYRLRFADQRLESRLEALERIAFTRY